MIDYGPRTTKAFVNAYQEILESVHFYLVNIGDVADGLI
jgi:hypothetical protein